MNKTLTVNIGGIVFHIEEQAYDKLKKYLDAIKAYFTSSDGRDEIIQDIEARIAEMFQEKIKTSQQPIVESEVDEVINLMGRPEQFAGDGKEENDFNAGSSSAYTTFSKGYRRIYRDPDDKVVGGVCAGLSHRFGLDSLWLRLAFAISFFAFGGGFLLYIVLMIVLPKAKTTAEKLEMRGEPVNIENIKKSVADEMESIRASMNEFTRKNKNFNADTFTRKTGSVIENIFETILDVIKAILRFAVKLFAVIMLLFGLLLFGCLLIALLAILGVGGIDVPIFITNFFLTPSQQFWAFASLFLLLGIPFLMLVYQGIKILFGIKHENSIVRYISGSLVGLGFIIAIYVGYSISKNYRYKDISRVTLPIIQPASDTLYIDAARNEKYSHGFGINLDVDDDFSVVSGTLDSIMRIRTVNLDIQRALGDSFELVKVQVGRGASREEAALSSRNMNYKFEQQDSIIILDESFTISKDVKFRNQRINLILKVPVGKTIYLDANSVYVIYDIENLTNTYDGNMVGHYWMMTPRGLKCTDYDFSMDQNRYNGDDDTHHITINGKTVDISSDAEVKIDKHGIDIKDDKNNVHVKVDENGVKIEDKGKNK